jgi:DNA-binding transcriptional ArsR family regulator
MINDMTAVFVDGCEVQCVHPEVVARVQRGMPAEERVELVTSLLKVMGDPSRFKILCALEQEEMCVCDLAIIAGIEESTTSHHLRLLRTSDFVTFRKAGRVAYYRLANENVARLIRDTLLTA